MGKTTKALPELQEQPDQGNIAAPAGRPAPHPATAQGSLSSPGKSAGAVGKPERNADGALRKKGIFDDETTTLTGNEELLVVADAGTPPPVQEGMAGHGAGAAQPSHASAEASGVGESAITGSKAEHIGQIAGGGGEAGAAAAGVAAGAGEGFGLAALFGVVGLGAAAASTSSTGAAASVAATVITGTISAGKFDGGVMVVAKTADGVELGRTELGKGANTFSITLNRAGYAGVVLLEVSDNNGAGTPNYNDEATRSAKDLGATRLRTALVLDGKATSLSVAITPVTELAVRETNDNYDQETVRTVNTAVSNKFGFDILATRPVTVDDTDAWNAPTTTATQKQYGLLLAALSGADDRTAGKTIGETLDVLARGVEVVNGEMQWLSGDLTRDALGEEAKTTLSAGAQHYDQSTTTATTGATSVVIPVVGGAALPSAGTYLSGIIREGSGDTRVHNGLPPSGSQSTIVSFVVSFSGAVNAAATDSASYSVVVGSGATMLAGFTPAVTGVPVALGNGHYRVEVDISGIVSGSVRLQANTTAIKDATDGALIASPQGVPNQAVSINIVHGRNTAQIQALTPDQVGLLSDAQLHTTDASGVAVLVDLTAPQIQALTGTQIAGLTSADVQRLSAAQQVAALSLAQLTQSLSGGGTLYAALSAEQKAALPQASVDSMTPDSGSSKTDFISNTADPSAQLIYVEFQGTISNPLRNGEIIQVSRDGTIWQPAVVAGNTWQVRLSFENSAMGGALSTDISNTLHVRISDGQGGHYIETDTQAYVLDLTAPAAPTVITLAPASDSGNAGDNRSNVPAPTFKVSFSTDGAAGAKAGDVLKLWDRSGTSSTLVGSQALTATDISQGFANITVGQGFALDGLYTLAAEIEDVGGNRSQLSPPKDYTLDMTLPSISITGLGFGADTAANGATNGDFITKTAAQTITATLGAELAADEKLYGSLDNGATWTDITSKVTVGVSTLNKSPNVTLAWDGVALTGSNTLQLKVVDTAGNDGPVLTQAYVLDAQAPTTTLSSLGFSADTAANGATNGDFVTQTAAQTITATLSAPLAADEKLYGSLDNGVNWIDITGKVTAGTTTGATTATLAWDAVTLTGSNTLQLKVVDTAGNDGPVLTQAYVLDAQAPTTTLSSLGFSADTAANGATNGDFITKTAAQTITATLSAPLATDEKLYGSLDNGVTWTDITGKVTASTTTGATTATLAWDGVTLTGSNTLQLKVVDTAGNDGPVLTQAYVLDTAAPAPTLAVAAGENNIIEGAETSVNLEVSYAGMAAGDTIQLKNGGAALGAAYTVVTGDVTAGKATLNVPRFILGDRGDKILSAEVTDVAGNAGSSAPLTISANNDAARMVIKTGQDAYLNASETSIDLEITYPGMQAGDTVQLKVDGATSGQPYTVTTQDATAGTLTLNMAKSALGSAEGVKQINADVSSAGANMSTAALAVTLDTIAPDAPAAIALDAASDTGTTGDNRGNDTTPSFRVDFGTTGSPGGAKAGDTVVLVNASGAQASTIGTHVLTDADVTHGWALVTAANSLGTDGAYTLTASITDAAGNTAVQGTTAITASYQLDATDPALNAPVPASGGTFIIGTDTAIVLGYTEPLTLADPGKVHLYSQAADGTLTELAASGYTVSVSANSLLVTPATGSLASGQSYVVHLDAGAVTDAVGNNQAAISNDTSVAFTAYAAPQLAASQAIHTTNLIDVRTDLALTFDQAIALGSGTITVKQDAHTGWTIGTNGTQTSFSGDIVIDVLNGVVTSLTVGGASSVGGIDLNTLKGSAVSVSGNQLRIDLTSTKIDLDFGSTYHVEATAGAITGAVSHVGNAAIGSTEAGLTSFTTVTPAADTAGTQSYRLSADSSTLEASYKWISAHQGDPTGSPVALDLSVGQFAIALQTDGGITGTTQFAGHVQLNGYSSNDLIYSDNRGNNTIASTIEPDTTFRAAAMEYVVTGETNTRYLNSSTSSGNQKIVYSDFDTANANSWGGINTLQFGDQAIAQMVSGTAFAFG